MDSNPSSKADTSDGGLIRLESVTKRFGRLLVLDAVDLNIRKGESTVVIGESGSGKSVMLKHIVGLLRPDSGRVYYNETRMDMMSERELAAVRKDFGFVFQMSALFDSLSAAENVAFPLREHANLDETEIERIVKEKLAVVGLDGVQPKRPAELSGGQRKRVAVARAISLSPSVILYDEPTTGLDPIRAEAINDLIIKLKRELSVTSIVVTHDMHSAHRIGDRIVMLYQGRFIADGTPDEIKATDDPRVRSFVDAAGDNGRVLE
jgi:phospholipid/cholesterol/gamma-HCH transport system ATP-binding protein